MFQMCNGGLPKRTLDYFKLNQILYMSNIHLLNMLSVDLKDVQVNITNKWT